MSHSTSPADAASPPPARSRRRRWVALGVLAAVLVVLGVTRERWLSEVARALVVDEPPWPEARVVVLPFNGGDGGGATRIAELERACGARGVVLFATPPSRIVALGVLPSEETLQTAALAARGVPEARIEVLAGPSEDAWQAGPRLADWLRRHADERVVVVADRFRGRWQREALFRGLSDEQRARVRLAALPSAFFDESDWHRTRIGVQAIFHAYVQTAFHLLHGPPTARHVPWDVDEFERQLRAAAEARP